jgi:hypothetical protein
MNQNNRQIALYTGAGLDILPYLNFPSYDFIACDSRPCNMCGEICKPDCSHLQENHTCPCHAPFVERLIGLMKLHGYDLIVNISYISPNYIIFRKGEQTIKYYYNTPYRSDIDLWNQYENTFSGLILSGFFPDSSVLKLLKNDAWIICSRSSCFENFTKQKNVDYHNKNTIVTYMHSVTQQSRYNLRNYKPLSTEYKYMFIDFETGKYEICQNISEVAKTNL